MVQTGFLTDNQTILDRGHSPIDPGAMIAAYRAGPRMVINLANDTSTSEAISVLLHYQSTSHDAKAKPGGFVQHIDDPATDVDGLAERGVQPGGSPIFLPDTPDARAHTESIRAQTTPKMLKEGLASECIAAGGSGDMTAFVAVPAPSTRHLLKDILIVEGSLPTTRPS
ncbi:hypothetical protein Tel_12480 [Candidatus Tenderia electrophaga]|jgi:hypothetical protein|uniref:Uncharacterized protein n=1 Tax=Candidatus Tenderia electrophaga TaxID=1748243 RepID=A0A0S2TFE1_9GAMM|nr:hypothetical protein Tel_12480 [Candidatus Tenderia electrophaga]